MSGRVKCDHTTALLVKEWMVVRLLEKGKEELRKGNKFRRPGKPKKKSDIKLLRRGYT